MEFIQHFSAIVAVFLIAGGFFNKRYRFYMYGVAAALLAASYGIHTYRMGSDPSYAQMMQVKPPAVRPGEK